MYVNISLSLFADSKELKTLEAPRSAMKALSLDSKKYFQALGPCDLLLLAWVNQLIKMHKKYKYKEYIK